MTTPRLPPSDLDAEAAVISACILDPPRLNALQLEPRHFYSESNGLVYKAAVTVHQSATPLDLVTLANELRASGHIKTVGGPAYLAQLCDATPAIANVAAHAQIVRELSDRRRAIHLLHERGAQSYGVELGDLILDMAADVEELRGLSARGHGWDRSGIAKIFAPLPPIPWVCEALELAPGPPTMWAGFGFSKKTLAAQSLALSVVAGLPAWGRFPCRQGRVLHIDFEQGERLTFDRYQRLAKGLGLCEQDLGGLESISFPPVYLDAAGAEADLVRELTGVALAVIDSFRACAPGTDENDSEARVPLDMLARVSEQTGCTILVIHHARKEQGENGKSAGGAKMSVRGSGALFDAPQCVLVLTGGETGLDPSTVEQVKARITAGTMKPHALIVADIHDPECEGYDCPPGSRCLRWGLTLTAEPAAGHDEDRAEADIDALTDRVLGVVRQCPGLSTGGVVLKSHRRHGPVSAALSVLASGGAVRNVGMGKSSKWVAVEAMGELA